MTAELCAPQLSHIANMTPICDSKTNKACECIFNAFIIKVLQIGFYD